MNYKLKYQKIGIVLRCKKLQDSEREIKEISFDSNTESLKDNYLDIFEGVKWDVMYTAQYDENNNMGQHT